MREIEILLASYNGGKYISEMIESILAQDCQNWHLTVSDDQSSDGTAEILEDFSQCYPDKITHYCSGRRFGNAQDHFMHLLSTFNDAPYVMFCDQDDVWHSDKVSKTLAKMKEIEVSGVPAMVHTDLRVVDGQLAVMDESFLHFSRMSGHRLALNNLLIQNVVTGCTMMLNHALAEVVCRNLPTSGIQMHDWWIALVAAATGTVGFLDEATMDYRQHGNNVVGAKDSRHLRTLVNKFCDTDVRCRMERSFLQARLLLNCCGQYMKAHQYRVVETYANLAYCGRWKRRVEYLKGGYLMGSSVKRLGQLLLG